MGEVTDFATGKPFVPAAPAPSSIELIVNKVIEKDDRVKVSVSSYHFPGQYEISFKPLVEASWNVRDEWRNGTLRAALEWQGVTGVCATFYNGSPESQSVEVERPLSSLYLAIHKTGNELRQYSS